MTEGTEGISQNRAPLVPRRVIVAEVISSRYGAGNRPYSWDERSPGLEEVRTEEGEALRLLSQGGQSSPDVGWELLLTELAETEQGEEPAYRWTLYGLKPPR